MTVTALVALNGVLVSSGTLGAFVQGEVRGVIGPSSVPFGPYSGSSAFQMTIYADTDGEELSFQLDTGSEQVQCSTTSTFARDTSIGNLLTPFQITCTT